MTRVLPIYLLAGLLLGASASTVHAEQKLDIRGFRLGMTLSAAIGLVKDQGISCDAEVYGYTRLSCFFKGENCSQVTETSRILLTFTPTLKKLEEIEYKFCTVLPLAKVVDAVSSEFGHQPSHANSDGATWDLPEGSSLALTYAPGDPGQSNYAVLKFHSEQVQHDEAQAAQAAVRSAPPPKF